MHIFLWNFFLDLAKLARVFLLGTFNESILIFQDSFLGCWAKGSSSLSCMLRGAWDTLYVVFSCSGFLPRQCLPRAGHCHEKQSWAGLMQACKNDHAGQTKYKHLHAWSPATIISGYLRREYREWDISQTALISGSMTSWDRSYI